MKQVVVIADGAHWIWNLRDDCFLDATRILDFYHMAENVHAYASALHPDDDKKKVRWAEKVIRAIKAGRFRLATDIVTRCLLKENTAKKTVNLLGYLENNRDRVRYDRFEEAGYYVGSGMIEGGNKVVIQKRLKQCGMRWSVSGGQFVASLRAKKQSGKWDIVQYIIFSKEAA